MEFRAGSLELAERAPALHTYLAKHADTYGGLYMDHQAGGRTTMLFTGNLTQRRTELRAVFEYPDRLTVRLVENSLAALDALASRIAADLPSLQAELGITSVRTDVISNRVRVFAASPDPRSVALLRARYGAVPIDVTTATFHSQGATGYQDAPPERGGQELNNGSPTGFGCSAGYVMTDGTHNFVTTAAHCGGTTYYQEKHLVGSVTKSTFGSTPVTTSSDAELISLNTNEEGYNSSFNFQGLDSNGNPLYIRLDYTQGQGGDNVGDTVCLSARASGYNCAQETAKNQQINNVQGSNGVANTLIFQRLVNFVGGPGDSGGTWLNPTLHEAVGQQEGTATPQNEDYFTQVYDLAQNLGESIVANNWEQTIQHDNPPLWYQLDDSLFSQTGLMSNPQANQHPTRAANSGYAGFALDGIVNGNVTFFQGGALINDPNHSALFDGLTGSIAIPAPTQALAPQVSAFTAEAWFWTTSTATQYIFSLAGAPASPTVPSSPAQPPVGIGLSGGIPFAVVTDVSGTSHQISGTSTQQYANGRWHHIALTDNGTTLTLYLDGTSLASTAVTGPPAYNGNQAGTIGSSGGTNFFSGYIDETAAYLYALTAQRISYHSTFGIYTGP